jgi:hypothetical protein
LSSDKLFEHRNGLVCSIKGDENIYQRSDYHLLEKEELETLRIFFKNNTPPSSLVSLVMQKYTQVGSGKVRVTIFKNGGIRRQY